MLYLTNDEIKNMVKLVSTNDLTKEGMILLKELEKDPEGNELLMNILIRECPNNIYVVPTEQLVNYDVKKGFDG